MMMTNLFLRQEWKDERLQWDPDEFDGNKFLSLRQHQLWLPDIVLYNT